jgi:antitoxin component YwqK of YwqJK toxin-antitoxin module
MHLFSRRFSCLFMALVLWHCAASVKPQQGFYGSGKLRYSIDRDKDGRKIGHETWWHETGVIKYDALYQEGFRNGKYSAFYPDGKSWYQGFEIMGRPESTLTYWYPNGQVRSEVFYRQGIQMSRKDWDEHGISLNAASPIALHNEEEAARREDSIKALRDREKALSAWGRRVRATVESFWVVPRELTLKGPLKAVASVKVRRDGHVEEVRWVTKSSISSFNTLAANTFKKIKSLPPFPKQVSDMSLEIEYAFVSEGQGSAKSRLRSGQKRDSVTGGGNEDDTLKSE